MSVMDLGIDRECYERRGFTKGCRGAVRDHGSEKGSCEGFVEAVAEHAYGCDDVAYWGERGSCSHGENSS